MGLLSNKNPPNWHPAHENLKKFCRDLARKIAEKNEDISEIALQFALGNESISTTLIGIKSFSELDTAAKFLNKSEIISRSDIFAEIVNNLKDLDQDYLSWKSGNF
jgi:aryl-alcohol dehydrogenase-like predicted oxidoreductase